MVCSDKSAREARQKETILFRLGESPHAVRDLIRRISKLNAEPCRELLYDLEAAGKVTCINDKWQLRKPVEVPATPLTLEA